MSEKILTPDQRIRVFISSRIPEFVAERKGLVRLIRQMGLIPVFFEEIPRPHPPRDLYRAYLEQSDIFLGIYGTGYGWIDTAGGMTISGLHDEWDLAANKPKIIFVQETKSPRDAALEKLLQQIGNSGVSYNRFTSRTELIQKGRAAIASHVTERYLAFETEIGEALPDFAVSLVRQVAPHRLITTDFFKSQLLPRATASARIFIRGSPGAGKSTSLYQISRAAPDAIYLSLRNQSSLSALLHIVRQLALFRKKRVKPPASVADAMSVCERLLGESPATVLIDDVDQGPDVAAQLSSLAGGRSCLVFAGRFVPPEFASGFEILTHVGFSPEEATNYLVESGAPLTADQFTAIENAQGSPLYLRYYLESAEQHPAQTLADYHTRMWNRLTSDQKEIVGLVATSEAPINFDELAQALTAYRNTPVTGIRSQDEVAAIGNVLSIQGAHVRIFHPAFKDHVGRTLDAIALAKPLHRALAQAFAKRPGGFLRIVHAVRAGQADEVYADLLRTAAWCEVTGRHKMMRVMLAASLRIARRRRDWLTLGLGLHQAAHLQQTTRSVQSALVAAQLSEQALARIRGKEALVIARSAKAVFLLEAGKGGEAEKIFLEVIDYYHAKGDSQAEAVNRQNLAFLYVRRGRMADVAVQCEIALKIFEANGDRWGVAVTLLNLQNHYVARHDRPNLIKCFTRLGELSRELDSPRLELAACNGRIILLRRLGKLPEAEKVSLKAIALARRLGLWDVEASNIANLGNVYRDQDKPDEARKCYETTIEIGRNKGSKHHIAFGTEQLASIQLEAGDAEAALKTGDAALALWRELGDTYREADTENDQGHAYRKLGRDFEAGKSFERAGLAWIRSGIPRSAGRAFGRATECLNDARQYSVAVACFAAAWKSLSVDAPPEAVKFLQTLSPVEPNFIVLLDLANVTTEAAKLFAAVTKRSDLIESIGAVAVACKSLRAAATTEIYTAFLKALATALSENPSPDQAIALAFAIEQAPTDTLVGENFTTACGLAAENCQGLRYHNDNNIGERWTVVLPARNAPAIEIGPLDEAAAARGVGAIAALMLWAKRSDLVKTMGRRKWGRLGVEFSVLPTSVAQAHGMKMPAYIANKETPVALARMVDPSDARPTALPLFVNDDFFAYADRSTNADNRCTMLVMMELHTGLFVNFTRGATLPMAIRKARVELMCDLFGLRSKDSKKSEPNSDLADDEIA